MITELTSDGPPAVAESGVLRTLLLGLVPELLLWRLCVYKEDERDITYNNTLENKVCGY